MKIVLLSAIVLLGTTLQQASAANRISLCSKNNNQETARTDCNQWCQKVEGTNPLIGSTMFTECIAGSKCFCDFPYTLP